MAFFVSLVLNTTITIICQHFFKVDNTHVMFFIFGGISFAIHSIVDDVVRSKL